MSVTVAVVVKDRLGPMSRCLAAVRAQQPPADEVVVVDNGSTDGTLELLRAAGDVRVVEEPGPLGAARQSALDACHTDVLAFTDSDCVPEAGWLAALCAALTDGVDVAQGRTVPANAASRRWSASQHVDGFTGLYETCNIAYRTSLLRAAGGFDRRTGFFGEDTAAGWRVRRLGGKGVFAADAVVRHDVTYPGPVWHLRRGLSYAAWPRLVHEFPEMRTDLLTARWFLRRDHVVVVTGVVSLASAVATRRPELALGALPWLVLRRPDRPGRTGAADLAAGLAFDVAALAGLLAGSARWRRVVL